MASHRIVDRDLAARRGCEREVAADLDVVRHHSVSRAAELGEIGAGIINADYETRKKV